MFQLHVLPGTCAHDVGSKYRLVYSKYFGWDEINEYCLKVLSLD